MNKVYYPFGLTFNSWHDSPENKYKFQGQEHQDETGWDSFKWRNSDPAIGRFFNIDPLAEDYYHNSTYAFSENKVVAHIELEGLESFDIKLFSNPANYSGRTSFGKDTPNSFKVDALGNISNSKVAYSNVEVSNFKSNTIEKDFLLGKGSRTITTMTLTGKVGAGNPLLKYFNNSGNESSFVINLEIINDSYPTADSDGKLSNGNGKLNIEAFMKLGDETESAQIFISGSVGDAFPIGDSKKILDVEGGGNEENVNTSFDLKTILSGGTNESKQKEKFNATTWIEE